MNGTARANARAAAFFQALFSVFRRARIVYTRAEFTLAQADILHKTYTGKMASIKALISLAYFLYLSPRGRRYIL